MNKFTIRAKVITAMCIGIVFMACEEPREYYLRINNSSSYNNRLCAVHFREYYVYFMYNS
jgi:hypothetical protein